MWLEEHDFQQPYFCQTGELKCSDQTAEQRGRIDMKGLIKKAVEKKNEELQPGKKWRVDKLRKEETGRRMRMMYCDKDGCDSRKGIRK